MKRNEEQWLYIRKVFAGKEPFIEKKFVDKVSSSFALPYNSFSSGQIDPFANPVQHVFRESGKKLVRWILDDEKTDAARECLMDIIRITFLRSEIPTDAVSFIYSLKSIFDEVACSVMEERDRASALLQIEYRFNQLIPVALDCSIYCRDKIRQIRIDELQKEQHRWAKIFSSKGVQI